MVNTKPSLTERSYEITDADLPLCCPLPRVRLWDAHPRVYLTLDEQGKAACPYCGSVFLKKEKTA